MANSPKPDQAEGTQMLQSENEDNELISETQVAQTQGIMSDDEEE